MRTSVRPISLAMYFRSPTSGSRVWPRNSSGSYQSCIPLHFPDSPSEIAYFDLACLLGVECTKRQRHVERDPRYVPHLLGHHVIRVFGGSTFQSVIEFFVSHGRSFLRHFGCVRFAQGFIRTGSGGPAWRSGASCRSWAHTGTHSGGQCFGGLPCRVADTRAAAGSRCAFRVWIAGRQKKSIMAVDPQRDVS